ncbi:universal stress protein [Rubrobacter aplysinae]|uniref:universal stress protein n=1 Tax=Rubrobacter aplysinae TaxID=909625 RepID=UPI00064C1D35|nr:universal stress protein [Rubrobacter aplysinae]
MSGIPKKILLATDGSGDAALARRATVDIASLTGAEVHVTHSWHIPPTAFPTVPQEGLYEQRARRLLDKETHHIEASGVGVEGHLERGRPVEGVLKLSKQEGVDLITLGGHGEGKIERALLGSVAEGVALYSPCPVLIGRGGKEAWPPARVIIGDDGSDAAREAGEFVARMGVFFDIRVLMVQAYPQPPGISEEERASYAWQVEDELRVAEGILEDRAKELQGLLQERVRTRVVVGNPAEVILRAAAEQGGVTRTLIALGTRGLGKESVRMGSVAKKVLQASRGPVLVHPGPAG